MNFSLSPVPAGFDSHVPNGARAADSADLGGFLSGLVLRSDRAVCGLSAARVWGLPIPPGYQALIEQAPVHVTSLAGARTTRRSGTTGHELDLPESHIAESHGIRVTNPARTWADCAALIEPMFLVAMGDVILGRQLATRAELADVVAWARRRRGVRSARLTLPVLDARAESPYESCLRWHMHEGGLPTPEVNVDVVVRGDRVFRLDLAYRLLRVGIEYDGDWHSETKSHDAGRRELLTAHGWNIVVAHKEDVYDPSAVIHRIREAIDSRTPRHGRW